MSDSGDASTSRKLWKLARNRKQTVSETALRYHCQKPAQRRPLSSIQYLQSSKGIILHKTLYLNYQEYFFQFFLFFLKN
jgi:hypothetical protein